ncbi:MAG: hypothetical protein Ta2B_07490 [Termitinemataceae bacterium]|nr:MAG: hypothetical protein Ta2B_07490 [Termitinemataceae bacterium]
MILNLKTKIIFAIVFSVAVIACKSTEIVRTATVPEDADEALYELVDIPPNLEKLPQTSFKEVWGYLVSGYESSLKANFPISDLVYFNAEVDRFGELVAVPKRKKLEKYKGRVHFSVACNGSGLTHFVLEPGSKTRKKLLAQLLEAAEDFDGLNMDFEQVSSRDADNYFSFLTELRAGLGKKIFSVCVPGRTKAGGPYDYARMAKVSDRVFVMAYDEHWSGSKPGPVASMRWCKTVAAYGLSSVGPEKLIMGLPFYGRGWGDRSTSRALIHSTTEKIIKENNIKNIERENGIPKFTYDINVSVTVYYEDTYSLSTRLEMYQNQGVRYVGFWRLGQEPVAIWNMIHLR